MNTSGQHMRENCTCASCRLGICPVCLHLFWIHYKEGGCGYKNGSLLCATR